MDKKKTPDPTKTESIAPIAAQFAATDKDLRGPLYVAASDETTYWAVRWGLVRYLPTLHDAALFLVQIGGRL